jgi:hypothetical protein
MALNLLAFNENSRSCQFGVKEATGLSQVSKELRGLGVSEVQVLKFVIHLFSARLCVLAMHNCNWQ